MRRLIRVFGIVAAIALWGAFPAFAAQHGAGAMGEQMRERHPHMMQMREQMAQRVEHLEELVAQMNRATGEQRIDAIAAVVNELASQHIEMHRMMHERPEKMRHRDRQQMMMPEE